jgi:hypothetical protein
VQDAAGCSLDSANLWLSDPKLTVLTFLFISLEVSEAAVVQSEAVQTMRRKFMLENERLMQWASLLVIVNLDSTGGDSSGSATRVQ